MVFVYLYNCYEFVNVYLVCVKIGVIFNLINFCLKVKEVFYIFQDVFLKVVVFEKVVELIVVIIERDFLNIFFWFIENDKFFYVSFYYEKVNEVFFEKVNIEIDEMDYCFMLYMSGMIGYLKGVLYCYCEMVEYSMICMYFLKYNRDSVGFVVVFLYYCGELNVGIILCI